MSWATGVEPPPTVAAFKLDVRYIETSAGDHRFGSSGSFISCGKEWARWTLRGVSSSSLGRRAAAGGGGGSGLGDSEELYRCRVAPPKPVCVGDGEGEGGI